MVDSLVGRDADLNDMEVLSVTCTSHSVETCTSGCPFWIDEGVEVQLVVRAVWVPSDKLVI